MGSNFTQPFNKINSSEYPGFRIIEKTKVGQPTSYRRIYFLNYTGSDICVKYSNNVIQDIPRCAYIDGCLHMYVEYVTITNVSDRIEDNLVILHSKIHIDELHINNSIYVNEISAIVFTEKYRDVAIHPYNISNYADSIREAANSYTYMNYKSPLIYMVANDGYYDLKQLFYVMDGHCVCLPVTNITTEPSEVTIFIRQCLNSDRLSGTYKEADKLAIKDIVESKGVVDKNNKKYFIGLNETEVLRAYAEYIESLSKINEEEIDKRTKELKTKYDLEKTTMKENHKKLMENQQLEMDNLKLKLENKIQLSETKNQISEQQIKDLEYKKNKEIAELTDKIIRLESIHKQREFYNLEENKMREYDLETLKTRSALLEQRDKAYISTNKVVASNNDVVKSNASVNETYIKIFGAVIIGIGIPILAKYLKNK